MQYWQLEQFFTFLNSLHIQVMQRQIAQHIKKSRITASSVIILRIKRTGCFTLGYTKKVHQKYEAEKVTECLCCILITSWKYTQTFDFQLTKITLFSKSTFLQMRSHTTPNHYQPQFQKWEYIQNHTLGSNSLKQQKPPTKSKLIIKSFYAVPPNEYQRGKVKIGLRSFFKSPERRFLPVLFFLWTTSLSTAQIKCLTCWSMH